MMNKKVLRWLSIRNFLPRTLFGRSLIILVTPVLLIQVISTIVFFDRHWNRMSSRLAHAVVGEITVLANAIEDEYRSDLRNKKGDGDGDEGGDEELKRVIEHFAKHLDIFMTFYGDEKLSLQKTKSFSPYVWESAVATTLIEQLDRQLGHPYALDIDFEKKHIEISVQLINGVLHASLPQRRLFSSSAYVFLLWMVGVSLLLTIVAIIFMRNQIRPIRRLAVAAERFGKGHDIANFKPKGAREVRQAAEAFLVMRKRIKRQIEQRTTMLAGVSHDLRTPLTRLKLQLAMLDENDDTRAMKSDIAEMEKMIHGYLDFVRGEGDEPVAERNMSDLVEKVVQQTQGQGVQISHDIDKKIKMELRPVAMERCLSNLLNNAVKHAKNVWVDVHVVDEKVEISVEDDGSGIPPELFEEVFRPFYRVDTSRNKNTGGVGLGLSIAMDIVHSHGGKIWLEESHRGGLAVKVSLPL